MLPPAKDTAIAHGGVPWAVIFSNPNVWLLSIQYMCLAYGWWFYINWLPTYLRDARGASFKMGALLPACRYFSAAPDAWSRRSWFHA